MSFEPEKITKEHVLEAIRLIKTESKSLIPSTGYDVMIDGIAYPPKEVMRYAHYIMNGESSWEYSGGESTNSFLSKMGFKIINKFQREHGRPLKLIIQYKKLLNEKQFEGETYKWEFTKLYHHRPNVQALDFNKEIHEINFSNLIYHTGIQVCHHIARERPEEYRNAFKSLFDESIDLTTRVNSFDEEVMRIYRNIDPDNKFSHHHDERTIATFLAFYDSNKYPFFKDSFYQKYCKLIDVNPEGKGKKYSHYLQLLNELIENFILTDNELLNFKEKFLPNDSYLDKNQYILAQDILYRTLDNSEGDELKYWRVGTSDDKGNYWNIMLQNEYVSIGWSDLGDLSNGNIKSQNDISVLLTSKGYYSNNKSVLTRKSGEILNFYSKMKTGDVVLAQDGSKVLAIGYITGDYGYDNSEVFHHYRPVEWKVINPNDFYNKDGNQTTIFPLTNTELIQKINNLLLTNVEKSIPNKMQRNIILYGPPGTGKTYHSIDLAVKIAAPELYKAGAHIENKIIYDKLIEKEQIAFTTFHQSMSYEDFIEGIKPQNPDEGEEGIRYEVEPGIFKIICNAAQTPNQTNFNSAYERLKLELVEKELIELKTPRNKSFSVSLNRNDNLALHTGPERIKQGVLTKENIQKQINGEDKFFGWEGYFQGVINYLKDHYNYSISETKSVQNFVLIIDEINRGNIAQIFGELITLIEDDKRQGMEESLKVTLPYSKQEFSIPPNLYIVGTMNTADRSVEAIDTALRRRFCFIEMTPRYNLKELNYEIAGYNAGKILNTINNRIEKLLDKDHAIGHSYFIRKNLETPEEKLLNTFYQNVIPLLQEYFFGDFGKIGLVLGPGFVNKKEWNKDSDSFADFDYESATEFEDRSVFEIIDYRKENEGTDEFLNAIRRLMNEKIE